MREIKFRGLDSMTGKWVYGNIVVLGTGSKYIIPQNVIGNAIPQWLVDRETVGQYTGLKDRSGKEIYEGDIVTWDVNGKEKNAPVYYDTEQARFWMGKERIGDSVFVCNDWMIGEYEVVGNIYENPELLEAK